MDPTDEHLICFEPVHTRVLQTGTRENHYCKLGNAKITQRSELQQRACNRPIDLLSVLKRVVEFDTVEYSRVRDGEE